MICSSKTIGYLEEDDDDDRSGKSVEASDVVHVNKYLFEIFQIESDMMVDNEQTFMTPREDEM